MMADPILRADLNLVQSILGIGQQTALLLLAELGDVRVFLVYGVVRSGKPFDVAISHASVTP